MTVRYTAQFPTVQFGYVKVEAEGDDPNAVYAEFVTSIALGLEESARLADPQSPAQAVQNLQQGGVVPQGQAGTGLPQVSGPPPWSAQTPQEQAAFIPPAQPQAQQQWQPSVQQQAPAQGPNCQHGPRVFRSSKPGQKPWSAYFCPTPKGTPGQCDPIFN